MAPRYWIMKTEPNAYSFEDLVREGSTEWDGVRNYQARNNMREMSVDDLVLIYHDLPRYPRCCGKSVLHRLPVMLAPDLLLRAGQVNKHGVVRVHGLQRLPIQR